MQSTNMPSLETLSATAEAQVSDVLTWFMGDGRNWLIWLAASFAIFLVLRFLRAAVGGILRSSKASPASVRNISASLICSTQQIFILVSALAATAPFLTLSPEAVTSLLPTILTILTIVQLAIWARILILGVLDGALDRGAADPRSAASLRSLVKLFVNVGLLSIAAVMILNSLNIDATGLVAGLGVGGIAIGLAAQSLFEDLFAGMSIMLDRPFVRGDYISFKTFSGTVEKVGLKTTRLRALTGEQLSVTNSNLLANEIQNFKIMRERRAKFTVGVTYSTPHHILASLPDKIKTIVDHRPLLRFDRCHLAAYGDSAILFECVYYVNSPDFATHMDEQQGVFLAVHKLFEEDGVEFAYPTQTIYLEKS